MIIYILIITHLLADFLFQSSAISERKREERKFFFFHCFIYFIVFEILFFLIFSIILDPASVFIRKLFILISPKSYPKTNLEELKAGNIIGKLERMIIAILLLNNQFGAMGFVLTAKSIARFKQMEDKNFAEKYLIGTLTSLFIVLLSVLILKGLL